MWDETQRAALARIGEIDRQDAAATARRYVAMPYRDMLDARPGETWQWHEAVGLGVFARHGRPSRPPVVRRQLAQVLSSLQEEARTVAEGARVAVPPATFAVEMVKISKRSVLVAGALAVGGWWQLREAEDQLEATLFDEVGYLDHFADELASGQIVRDGRFVRRAMLYAAVGWSLYQVLRGRRAAARGYVEEQSVLDPGAEHCDECVAEAAREWQPVGSLVPVGDRQCRGNCRCFMRYRNGQGEIAE